MGGTFLELHLDHRWNRDRSVRPEHEPGAEAGYRARGGSASLLCGRGDARRVYDGLHPFAAASAGNHPDCASFGASGSRKRRYPPKTTKLRVACDFSIFALDKRPKTGCYTVCIGL